MTSKHSLVKTCEKYSLKKKPDNSPKDLKASEATKTEIIETITTNKNNTYSKESTHKPTNEEDLNNLFEQYSSLTPPTSD